jgi:magnesium chelatase family protein
VLAKVDSCSLAGLDGFIVEVEVDIAYGLPVFNIVGLPEISIRESKERVKTAIKNCGYTFPMERLVVNLAPADIKKEGTGLDLPIAIGILVASEVIPFDKVKEYLISGELSLNGKIKPVKAVLSYALTAKENGYKVSSSLLKMQMKLPWWKVLMSCLLTTCLKLLIFLQVLQTLKRTR